MIVTGSREFQSKLHVFYRDPNETEEISVIIVVKTLAVWILHENWALADLHMLCTWFEIDILVVWKMVLIVKIFVIFDFWWNHLLLLEDVKMSDF